MKSIKFIFAFSLFLMAFTACTSDDQLSADETLYNPNTIDNTVYATGDEGTATWDDVKD
ncbi:hypothetical protein [Lutibacter sp.]